MRFLALLPLFAACTSNSPSQQSLEMFSNTTAAMASAQARAVASAQGQTSAAPGALTIGFTGACTLGGTVDVAGTYDGTGTGQDAAFDLTITFDACAEPASTLTGMMEWTSVMSGTAFTATETGSIDDVHAGQHWSCDFDLGVDVDSAAGQESFSGTVCGDSIEQSATFTAT